MMSVDNEKFYDKPHALRITFLDGFRGYAIAMVVATHAIAYANLELSIVSVISFWVQAVAVPPFFLADGFLFVQRLQKNPHLLYAAYCIRSARRLLIPWICFSSLYLVLRAGFEFVGHPPITFVLGHNLGEILQAVYYSSISSQLYFLPALFIVRLLSFATRYLIALPSTGLIFFWFAYVYLWQAMPIGNESSDRIDPVINAMWGMQFYLLGMVLSVHKTRVEQRPFYYAAVSLICLLVVKIGAPAWAVMAQYAYLCCLFFAFVGLADKAYPFTMLGGLTMGIYLIHAPIILKFVSSAAAKVFDQSGLVRYLVISGGALLISMIVVKLCAGAAWWTYMLGEEAKETTASGAGTKVKC
jgi:surface polysaccharide O-acyltransferase-like enzyme